MVGGRVGSFFLRGRDGMGYFVGEGEGALTLEQLHCTVTAN